MYAKISGNTVAKFPYSVGDLRRDNSNVSFPRSIPDGILADYGVVPVNPVPAPNHDDRTQKVERNAQPHQEGGEWFIGWTVYNKTAEEVRQYDDAAAKANRKKRDGLLAATDWVVIMHTEKGTNIPADMELYRQALRDITNHANWPHLEEADWPVKP